MIPLPRETWKRVQDYRRVSLTPLHSRELRRELLDLFPVVEERAPDHPNRLRPVAIPSPQGKGVRCTPQDRGRLTRANHVGRVIIC